MCLKKEKKTIYTKLTHDETRWNRGEHYHSFDSTGLIERDQKKTVFLKL